jgi:hypothetical protein
MRSVALSLVIGLIASSGAPTWAASPAPLPRDLTAVMKAMGADLRRLKDQMAKPEMNAQSAALCDDLSANITDASGLPPDSIAALSADKQRDALQTYREKLGQLKELVAKLKADFVSNNNAQAATDLNKIIASRNDGHQVFYPDDSGTDLAFPQNDLIAHCVWLIGPSLSDEAIMRVTWQRKSDPNSKLAFSGFLVKYMMPSMPEMNVPAAKIDPVKDTNGNAVPGQFQVSGMYFFMAGSWSVELSPAPAPGTQSETNRLSIDVPSE